jgi:ubiquitin C-terminal hydrolase
MGNSKKRPEDTNNASSHHGAPVGRSLNNRVVKVNNRRAKLFPKAKRIHVPSSSSPRTTTTATNVAALRPSPLPRSPPLPPLQPPARRSTTSNKSNSNNKGNDDDHHRDHHRDHLRDHLRGGNQNIKKTTATSSTSSTGLLSDGLRSSSIREIHAVEFCYARQQHRAAGGPFVFTNPSPPPEVMIVNKSNETTSTTTVQQQQQSGRDSLDDILNSGKKVSFQSDHKPSSSSSPLCTPPTTTTTEAVHKKSSPSVSVSSSQPPLMTLTTTATLLADRSGLRPRANSTDFELKLPRRGLCDEQMIQQYYQWQQPQQQQQPQHHTNNKTAKKQQMTATPKGLMNLGNTCFLNSILQCLTYSPVFCQAMLQMKSPASAASSLVSLGNNNNKLKVPLARTIRQFLQSMQSASSTSSSPQHQQQSSSPSMVVAPRTIADALPILSRRFRRHRQEDAHECLVHLLDALHNDALAASGIDPRTSGWRHRLQNHRLDETTYIHRMFGGYLRSQIQCRQCPYRSNTYDAFLDLHLDINRGDSIISCLREFTTIERLEHSNAYYCDQCRKKVTATKQLDIFRPPLTLLLQLKRFEVTRYNGISRKITKAISYPLSLRIPLSDGRSCEYHLTGLVLHRGETAQCGHYTSVVQTPDGGWCYMDDERVKPLAVPQLVLNFQTQVYLLMYCRSEVKLELPQVPNRKNASHNNNNSTNSDSSTSSDSSTTDDERTAHCVPVSSVSDHHSAKIKSGQALNIDVAVLPKNAKASTKAIKPKKSPLALSSSSSSSGVTHERNQVVVQPKSRANLPIAPKPQKNTASSSNSTTSEREDVAGPQNSGDLFSKTSEATPPTAKASTKTTTKPEKKNKCKSLLSSSQDTRKAPPADQMGENGKSTLQTTDSSTRAEGPASPEAENGQAMLATTTNKTGRPATLKIRSDSTTYDTPDVSPTASPTTPASAKTSSQSSSSGTSDDASSALATPNQSMDNGRKLDDDISKEFNHGRVAGKGVDGDRPSPASLSNDTPMLLVDTKDSTRAATMSPQDTKGEKEPVAEPQNTKKQRDTKKKKVIVHDRGPHGRVEVVVRPPVNGKRVWKPATANTWDADKDDKFELLGNVRVGKWDDESPVAGKERTKASAPSSSNHHAAARSAAAESLRAEDKHRKRKLHLDRHDADLDRGKVRWVFCFVPFRFVGMVP